MGLFSSLGEAAGNYGGAALKLLNVGGEGGAAQIDEILQLWDALPLPEYDKRNLLAPHLVSAGDMGAETYEVADPGGAALIGEDPALRTSQLRGLQRAEQRADSGMTLADRLRADEAQRSVSAEIDRARDTITTDLARRGRAGSGRELALRLASLDDQAESARGAGSDIAQMSLAEQLMAEQTAADMAGRIRGADLSKEAQNAAIQNNYNAFLANLRTQANANAAAAKERAKMYSLGNRQRISDANIGSQYTTQRENQANLNNLANQMFGARATKLGGQTGALTTKSWQQYAKKKSTEDALHSMSAASGKGGGGVADMFYGGGGGSIF